MADDSRRRTVKVAIIGSGLAGLSSAYMLSQANDSNVRFEPHLFEKNQELGMDAASITTPTNFRIDVPMRSFMSGYYSHLMRLYEHLKIPILPAKFSFGWYDIQSPSRTEIAIPASEMAAHTKNRSHLLYSGSRTVGLLESSSELFSDTLKHVIMGWWRMYIVAVSYLWLMAFSLWLHYRGHLRNKCHPVTQKTLGQWFQEHNFHPYFVHQVFVPLFAAVCTNTWTAMLNYPAADVLEYMAMGLFQESYVVSGGVRQVVGRLASPLEHVHLDTHIISIQRRPEDNATVLQDQHGRTYEFDHVIFATQGNQAACIIETSAEASLRESMEATVACLKQFEYEVAVVINHTDTRLLPDNRKHWRALNLARLDERVQPTGKSKLMISTPHHTTMTTHVLNKTHTFDDATPTYLQTTNPNLAPDPEKVLSVSWFERATVTMASKKALETGLFVTEGDATRLGPCQGKNGIWFVGSYCWRGIPLLEGCVASAEKVVAEGIGKAECASIEIPW